MEKQNSEQYKKDQDALEEIPKISPEYHFFLNDISDKLLSGKELYQTEVDNLEIIYDLTQSLEPVLVDILDFHRANLKISRIEYLFTVNYFLTANQNGPDSTNIKDAIISKRISVEGFEDLLNEVQMPTNTRMFLLHVYEKLI